MNSASWVRTDDLRRRYHRWLIQRRWNYHRENAGHEPNWAGSDDDAVDLLQELAEHVWDLT